MSPISKQKILIIDDEPTQSRLIESLLTTLGYTVQTAKDGFEALKILEGEKASEISAVLLDLVMPRKSGIEVMTEGKSLHPQLPFIIMTANGSVNTVIEAMRAGASDFIVKPVNSERLQVSLQNALKVSSLTTEIQKLKRKNDNRLCFSDLIAESPLTKEAITMAKRAAGSSIPVLIDGESGVGKEVMARAIQGESLRSGKPFIAVNCGAIPENLVESILFGHEKGAFTGAVDRHIGRFQEADGGTLFLDEVGELKLDIQVKLLRALQEGEIDRVGGTKPIKVNVRLISATNKNLAQLVEEGKFREDLFYRLNVFQLTLPPLRQRREDITGLVQHFIKKISAEENKVISGVDTTALQMLEAYHWPGNIRQLENTLFRAIVLAEDSILKPQDFPSIQLSLEARRAFQNGQVIHPLRRDEDRLAEKLEASLPKNRRSSDRAPSQTHICIIDKDGKVRSLKEIEEDIMRIASIPPFLPSQSPSQTLEQ
jgi:DNA-binding NtrC family response regulator